MCLCSYFVDLERIQCWQLRLGSSLCRKDKYEDILVSSGCGKACNFSHLISQELRLGNSNCGEKKYLYFYASELLTEIPVIKID